MKRLQQCEGREKEDKLYGKDTTRGCRVPSSNLKSANRPTQQYPVETDGPGRLLGAETSPDSLASKEKGEGIEGGKKE